MAGIEKKLPERRCVGCGNSFPKKDLYRVVKAPDGCVFLDITGKKSGRGAYVCKKIECFRKARKAKRFEKNLEIMIPDTVYNELEARFNENA